MVVDIILHGHLSQYVQECKELRLNIKEEITINELLNSLGIPEGEVAAARVNQRLESLRYYVKEGETVEFIPGIYGG